MKLPVLRWPGGCFADEYHWKDGIGPKEKRKKMINTHWGGVTEDNSFGTHEYFELCSQLGCKTYINGNVGSGTVQEMSEWVEYMTFDGVSPMAELRKQNGHEKPWKVDYFGVGNENWGCGGNMTPDYYGNLYRRYQTYVRNYNGNAPIFKICCGPNAGDTYWTENVLKTCYENAPKDVHGFMNGLSMHYYVVPNGWTESKGKATEFDNHDWYKTLSLALDIETLIKRHSTIMDKYDPEKKIGLICDEWGTWFDVEPGTNPGFLYQQSTMRDALVAGLSLNVFNKHCDRVKMANIAQLINVLQAVILTDGSRMIKTPTYYVFHMYKYHQDAELVESYLEGVKTIGEDKEYQVPNLQESVSVDKDGVVTITINNLSVTDSEHIDIAFAELKPSNVTAAIVTNKMDAHNTFENPDVVKEEEFKAYTVSEAGISFEIPACSVVQFRVQ
jgi:alpha-N-arabinofuranosidase